MSEKRQGLSVGYVWIGHPFTSPSSARRYVGGVLRAWTDCDGLERLLLSVLLASVALRFVALSRHSLWTDELFSVFWAKSGVAYALSHAGEETNPPLYYLLLDTWMAVFGESEGSVRLFSAAASAATMPVVYALGRALFDRRAGLVAALCFGLSSSHLYFAQEARCYAVFNLVFAVSLLGIVHLTRLLRQGAPPARVTGSLAGAGFVLGMVVAVYLHYAAFAVLLALAIVLALMWWKDFAFDRRYLECFAALGALVAVLSAPALALAVAQRHSASVAWIPFPAPTEILDMATGMPQWEALPEHLHRAQEFVCAVFALGWAVPFVYGAWQRRAHPAWIPVYILPLVGFGVLTAASIAQPLLISRTLLWTSIPVYLGVGGAVAAWWDDTRRRRAATAMLLAGAVFTAGYFVFSSNEPWRAWVPEYAAGRASHDLIVLGNDTPATAFLYYREEQVVPLLRRWPGSATSADRLDEHVTGIRDISDAEIAAAAQRGAKLLFVSRDCAAPAAIDRADVVRLRRCDWPPRTGWLRIFRFVRHVLAWSGVG